MGGVGAAHPQSGRIGVTCSPAALDNKYLLPQDACWSVDVLALMACKPIARDAHSAAIGDITLRRGLVSSDRAASRALWCSWQRQSRLGKQLQS